MTTLSAAKALLEADATLLALATGGVWDWNETGRMGINRTNTAAAFTSTGIIKPCILLKLRSSVPFGDIADDSAQVISLREMLEIWLYADNTFTAIESMRARVFTLLHGKQLTGTFVCRWAQDVYAQRDVEMDAFVERSDYAIILKRG